MRHIDAAISRHRGKRILITFGAGHEYWFLEKLSERSDVTLVDPTTFIQGVEGDAMSLSEACLKEVIDLHRFFEDWGNGKLPDTDESFARFSGAVADDFEIVSPEGGVTSRAALVSGSK